MTSHLVDLASYQHGIDLAVVKAAGFSRVNIKLTQGTSYVNPYIEEFVDGARANGLDICTFHWLDGRSSGAAQAQYALAQMDRFGLRLGTAHQCDCEDTQYPASWLIWRDYVNAMQDALGRPIINYTGDWWWPAHMGANNGAAVTPYLWAAPNHGYDTSYPGDSSSDWNAGYGGWSTYSALQYAVSPISGAGGGDLSKTAFREPHVWTALTGVDAASITITQEDDLLFLAKGNDPADQTVYLCNWMKSRPLTMQAYTDLLYAYDQGTIELAQGPDNGNVDWVDADPSHPRMLRMGWNPVTFGPVDSAPAPATLSADQIAQIAAALQGAVPTAAQVATAVEDEEARRLAG